MRPSSGYALSAILAALAACTSQAMPTPLPAPAGSASAAVRADTQRTAYSAADVRFMQGMIGHHAQALEMVALIPGRSTRREIALLGERIRVSQESELTTMQAWLRARGEAVPAAGTGSMQHAGMAGMDHAAMDHALMPGMLTPEQMAQLAAASGPAFERLFLEGMIRHHQGALQMVAELFASQGAAQEPQVFGFASDVDADQRAEIARMEALLATYAPTNPR
jgi:uncharacterized protein (DUF305 family)